MQDLDEQPAPSTVVKGEGLNMPASEQSAKASCIHSHVSEAVSQAGMVCADMSL